MTPQLKIFVLNLHFLPEENERFFAKRQPVTNLQIVNAIIKKL